METTLHRQFKSLYASNPNQTERKVGAYRIDVATKNSLIEIQHSSLNSIRSKVADLLQTHQVVVVKPLVLRKRIVRLNRKGGQVMNRRWSPKRGHAWDLFDELIYFRNIFPHAKLKLEVPLVDIEEWRFQGQGRKRRQRVNNFLIQDQMLLKVHQTLVFQNAADLLRILGPLQEHRFDTLQLSKWLNLPRWKIQKIVYTLHHCGAISKVDKSGNANIFQVPKMVQRELIDSQSRKSA